MLFFNHIAMSHSEIIKNVFLKIKIIPISNTSSIVDIENKKAQLFSHLIFLIIYHRLNI